MDELNLLFTNVSILKKIIHMTALNWGLHPDDTLIINSPFGTTSNGYVLGNENGMLSTVQNVSCKVNENVKDILVITLIHHAEEGQLSCQAYNHFGKPVLLYYHNAVRNKEGNEIQNYVNTLIKI